MQTIDILKSLSGTNKRTEKEQIIFKAFCEGNREFFVLARLAYDPLISFGIKKVALIEETGEESDLDFSFDKFLKLAHKLRKRELTGDAARNAVNNAALNCDAELWNTVYRRVLLKDLKVGITKTTINNVLKKLASSEPEAKDYLIPVFGCQLAHDGAKPTHAKKIKGKKYLDFKLDGVRLITVLDKISNSITQYSREGQVIETFSEIRKSLEPILKEIPSSIVLDGEVIGRSFQELMTQLQRKEGIDDSNAKLAVFDIIPFNDFFEGKCNIPQDKRHAALLDMNSSGMFQNTNGLVFVVPKVMVNLGTEDGAEQFKQFNREAIEAGYEGIMVKDVSAPYEGKRTAHWLKIKPFIEVSLSIMEVQEGKDEGKYKGMLGGLLCRGTDDGKNIEVVVGSGFTDDQRKEFWENRDNLIGMVVEIRGDALTLNQDSKDLYSVRFPRFKGFRGIIPGEKL